MNKYQDGDSEETENDGNKDVKHCMKAADDKYWEYIMTKCLSWGKIWKIKI